MQAPPVPRRARGLVPFIAGQGKTLWGGRLPRPDAPHLWGAQAPCSLQAPAMPFLGHWASCTALPVTPATVAEQGTGQPTDSWCHPTPTPSFVHAGLHRCACTLWCRGFGKGGTPPGHPALGAQSIGLLDPWGAGGCSQPLPKAMHSKRGSNRRGVGCQQGRGSPKKTPADSPCLHSHPWPQHPGQSIGSAGKSWRWPCRQL